MMPTKSRETKDTILASLKNLKWGNHTASPPLICRENFRGTGTFIQEGDEERLDMPTQKP